ncbi:MAG TPA: type II toxin-antitoxin system VapC family toxin [Anaerolineae bacterium]|nr:type II toxin-antitoxin system VapC family toxin [Anaerolineae bacterium]HQI84388.1 type II toxin-antitoxin system VapC family toxin [Anaerolineae bacterium]
MLKHLYFDTSALGKHYITEAGSRWVQLLVRNKKTIVLTSSLTRIEGICTFARRRREGMLSEDDLMQVCTIFNYDLAHHYVLAEADLEILSLAQQLALRYPLRAYDTVPLATAEFSNRQLVQAGKSPLTFVCADDRLLAIAKVEGLLIENPNHHP